MNKKSGILMLAVITAMSAGLMQTALAVAGPFGYDLEKDINRTRDAQQAKQAQENAQQDEKPAVQKAGVTITEKDMQETPIYYPKAALNSAIAKYKAGNYSGCLQELQSYVQNDMSNPLAYYYMGMSYTQVGDRDKAIEAYNKVIELSPNDSVGTFAAKGRDCLTGGPACKPPQAASAGGERAEGNKVDEGKLDEFINAPYGNGMSPELTEEMRKRQLENIQKTINKKEILENSDLEKIRKIDNHETDSQTIKIADASDADVAKALRVLKDAGYAVTVQPAGMNPAINPASKEFAQAQEIQAMSAMLNGGNNNNNNSMMNMLPYMMQQGGQNMDPQVIQAMMMNSMIPDFTMNMNDDNKY